MPSPRIALLTCAGCLSSATPRREDAYEHDREMAAFVPAFRDAGMELVETDWRSGFDASDYDLVWVRSTWDYAEHCPEFLAMLDAAAKLSRVANSPALIRWNLNKHYLMEMDPSRQPIIPSLFVGAQAMRAAEAFDALGCDQLVAKPVVGAAGLGQRLLARGADDDALIRPGQFAQPLIASIRDFGEISLIFIAGTFSHAVRKTARGGEYRIQVIHGGGEDAYTPDDETVRAAARYLDALPTPAVAVRVDLVRGDAGWLLMELEAIEPHLFPNFGQDVGERCAAACWAMLG